MMQNSLPSLAQAIVTESWRTATGVQIVDIAQAQAWLDRLTEPAFTRAIGLCGAAVEERILSYLAYSGHLTRLPGQRLLVLSGERWRRLRAEALGIKPSGLRVPDLIVADANDDYRPVLILEVKGRAAVNGGAQYCPLTCGYSNQIVCYRHRCWFPDRALDDAPRMWIGPVPPTDPRVRAVHHHEVEKYPDFFGADFYERQSKAANQWLYIDIREFVSALTGTALGEMGRLWLDKIGCQLGVAS